MPRTAFSLFSGAGGLDLGVEQAGFDVTFAIESDPVAVSTLNLNRNVFFKTLPMTETMDITNEHPQSLMRKAGMRKGDVDLLVGGPPCVAFSKSGFHLEYKRAGKDPRAGLLHDYLRFLEAMRPRVFMFENVFGLLYRNHSATFFDAFIRQVKTFGYAVTYDVLNAADYGVPQNRQRLFVVGTRDRSALRLPAPTHWGELERRIKPSHANVLAPHVTAGEALRGLRTRPEAADRVSGRYGHLLPDIPPGKNYLHFTDHEGHPKPLFKWRSRYWTFLLKLDPKRPASTIQGQPGPYVGPFHWKNRRLRVPELKRLQSFPDEFKFNGTRRDIQLQVGNSVPPLLAYCVADAIRRQLDGEVILPPPHAQLSFEGL
jgi:DNA (cytosine-5)-methyltransferase 1